MLTKDVLTCAQKIGKWKEILYEKLKCEKVPGQG